MTDAKTVDKVLFKIADEIVDSVDSAVLNNRLPDDKCLLDGGQMDDLKTVIREVVEGHLQQWKAEGAFDKR